jgi:hypothetical protein
MSRVVAIALVGVLSTPSPGSAVFRYPHRIVWRGTVTSPAGSGRLVARTHRFTLGARIDYGYASYEGRFRCRGNSCPAHRGSASLSAEVMPDRIRAVSFDARVPTGLLTCFSYFDEPPPAFGVNGTYQCYLRPGHPPDVHLGPLVVEGTLALVPSRVPREVQ